MDNPLVREAVVSACSIIAQTAAAANGPFQHSAARKQAEEKEMLIWDTRVKETIVSFVDALPEDQISSNDWWENIVFQQPESRFISDFRMTKNRFKDLCDWLYPEGDEPRRGAPVTPPDKRFGCALYRLFRYISVTDVSSKFGSGCAPGSVINHTNELISKLVAKGPQVICFPTFEQQQRSADAFYERYGYPDIAMVGDGTHIPITSPLEFEQDYVNYKGFHSFNLSGMVTYNYLFGWVNTGWPGVTGDSHVLKCSPLWSKLEHGELLKPGLRIGLDSAYPLRQWSATPYRAPLSHVKAAHNNALSKARSRAEHPWAKLFGRFRSLQMLNIETAQCPAWIYACCVLHNLLESSDEPFEDELLEVEPVFPLLAMQQQRPEDVGADGDGDVEMGDADVVIVAGPAAETASARRDRVAKQIWNERNPDNVVA